MPRIRKSRKPFAHASPSHLLTAVVGLHNTAAAYQEISRYRLASVAKVLEKTLRDKKRRQTARIMDKARRLSGGQPLPEEIERLREYGTARAYRVPFRTKVRYEPEPVAEGQKPKWYFRKVENEPRSKKKISALRVGQLITREKAERAKNNIRRTLGTTKAETDAIIRRANAQVLKEFRAFKKTAKYRNLSKAEKAKVKFSRWKRWTLVGISVVLGDSYD